MGQNIFLRLSKREKYIACISIIAVIAIFFDRVIVCPIMERLGELNSEVAVQEKKLWKATQILSEEALITGEHSKFVQGLEQDGSDEEEVAALLSEIEKLATKSTVFLANIKPRLPEENEHYKKYLIETDLESKITKLVDFIYQLEKSPCLFRVEEFYLVPKKEGSGVLKARMVISGILIAADKHVTPDYPDVLSGQEGRF
ncbi:MAG: hypothetical protein U9Q08_04555 [Candidatus Omnitrophota bacterium]|nr:hypothetical protein [Candidatus Omnitrophota bacterium]